MPSAAVVDRGRRLTGVAGLLLVWLYGVMFVGAVSRSAY